MNRTQSTITIHTPGGGTLEVLITEESRRVVKLMQEDCIELHFTLAKAVDVPAGSWCEDELFGKFCVTEEQQPTYDTANGGYAYTLKMEAWYRQWGKRMAMLTAKDISSGAMKRKEAEWHLTAPLKDHMREFMCNLRVLGVVPQECDFLTDDTDLMRYVDIRPEVAAANSSYLVSYSAASLLDTLNALCDLWHCEWWVTGTPSAFVIHLGKCEVGEAVVPMSVESEDVNGNPTGGNAESITASRDTSVVGDKMYYFGSADNIPITYRKELRFTAHDIELAAVGSDTYVRSFRLHDPASGKPSELNSTQLQGSFDIEVQREGSDTMTTDWKYYSAYNGNDTVRHPITAAVLKKYPKYASGYAYDIIRKIRLRTDTVYAGGGWFRYRIVAECLMEEDKSGRLVPYGYTPIAMTKEGWKSFVKNAEDMELKVFTEHGAEVPDNWQFVLDGKFFEVSFNGSDFDDRYGDGSADDRGAYLITREMYTDTSSFEERPLGVAPSHFGIVNAEFDLAALSSAAPSPRLAICGVSDSIYNFTNPHRYVVRSCQRGGGDAEGVGEIDFNSERKNTAYKEHRKNLDYTEFQRPTYKRPTYRHVILKGETVSMPSNQILHFACDRQTVKGMVRVRSDKRFGNSVTRPVEVEFTARFMTGWASSLINTPPTEFYGDGSSSDYSTGLAQEAQQEFVRAKLFTNTSEDGSEYLFFPFELDVPSTDVTWTVAQMSGMKGGFYPLTIVSVLGMSFRDKNDNPVTDGVFEWWDLADPEQVEITLKGGTAMSLMSEVIIPNTYKGELSEFSGEPRVEPWPLMRKGDINEGDTVVLGSRTDYGVPYKYFVNAFDDPSSMRTVGTRRLMLPRIKRETFDKYAPDGMTFDIDADNREFVIYSADRTMVYRDGYIMRADTDPNAPYVREITVTDDNCYPDGKLIVHDLVVTKELEGQEVSGESKTDTVEWKWGKYHLQLRRPGSDSVLTFDKRMVIEDAGALAVRFLVPEDMEGVDGMTAEDTDRMRLNSRLAGMQFEVEWLKSHNFKAEQLTEGTPGEREHVFSMVRSDPGTYGCKLPNDTLRPMVGDPCVLVNWDARALGGLGLIDEAEYRLLKRAFDYFAAMQEGNFTFTVRMMSDYFGGADSHDLLSLGQKVEVHNGTLTKRTRVTGYTLKMDIPWDTPEYTCGETEAYSRLKAIEAQVYSGGASGLGTSR